MPDAHTALVTGAGRGIGRATAELLAERGMRVLAVSRTESELADLAASHGVDYLVESVADEDGCARIAAETLRRLGHLDVLVNNAGMGSVEEDVTWLEDPAVWHRSIATNLTAPFELSRRLVPTMIERLFGRVVMVASAASLASGVAPGMPAYAASKHGLLGLTRALALELAPYGVTCNAVLPGSVRTRTAEAKVAREAAAGGMTVEEAWDARRARYRAGRFVTAREVAEVIGFLASEQAAGVNGEGVLVALQGAV